MTVNDILLARDRLRNLSPIIHSITNPISINLCANGILAVGARPIMAEHPSEVREITASASALLLNLGNITDVRKRSMKTSLRTANKLNIPVVLDAVGVCSSRLRRRYALKLLKGGKANIIKGNYSEIRALADASYSCGGVDADPLMTQAEIELMATELSVRYGATVLASGKCDVITDGKVLLKVGNGSARLPRITGTGCLLGALCASFLSVCDGLTAAVCSCAYLGISGELAESVNGNGSFEVKLIDCLSCLDEKSIINKLRLEETVIEKI